MTLEKYKNIGRYRVELHDTALWTTAKVLDKKTGRLLFRDAGGPGSTRDIYDFLSKKTESGLTRHIKYMRQQNR